MGCCCCCSRLTSQSSVSQNTSKVTSIFVYDDLLSKSIFSALPNPQQIINKLFRQIQSRKPEKQKIYFSNIFRASDHNHKASAFRQICHNKCNTLVIAITTQNRIYGGFTPSIWLNNMYYQYKQDIQLSSFLFTIDDNQIKFYNLIPSQSKKAIVNHTDSGPIFGQGHDLYISDQSDKYDSWCNLGKTYQCQFDYGTNKANMEFSGQLRHKIKDYQVWELIK